MSAKIYGHMKSNDLTKSSTTVDSLQNKTFRTVIMEFSTGTFKGIFFIGDWHQGIRKYGT